MSTTLIFNFIPKTGCSDTTSKAGRLAINRKSQFIEKKFFRQLKTQLAKKLVYPESQVGRYGTDTKMFSLS